MAVMGTLAEGCDITPSLRSGFQMLHEKSKLQQGGGPGGLMVVQACVVEDVLEPEINKETWAELAGGQQGGAGQTELESTRADLAKLKQIAHRG